MEIMIINGNVDKRNQMITFNQFTYLVINKSLYYHC